MFVYDGRGATYSGSYGSFNGVLKRHGVGEFVDGDSRYVGHWQEDLMHGEGTYWFPTGASYSGHWVAGLFDGHGTYQWPDGTFYTGDFKQNTWVLMFVCALARLSS